MRFHSVRYELIFEQWLFIQSSPTSGFPGDLTFSLSFWLVVVMLGSIARSFSISVGMPTRMRYFHIAGSPITFAGKRGIWRLKLALGSFHSKLAHYLCRKAKHLCGPKLIASVRFSSGQFRDVLAALFKLANVCGPDCQRGYQLGPTTHSQVGNAPTTTT